MAALANMLVTGLAMGGAYALLAIGFALPFGTCGVLHLAHGAVIAAAIFGFYWVVMVAKLPFALGLAAAVAVALALSLGTHLLVYRPLRRRGAPSLILFLSSLGLLILVENILLLIFGADIRLLPYAPALGALSWQGVTVTRVDLVASAVSALLLVGVVGFVRWTRLGRNLRALASNRALAELMGIDVGRSETIVFVLSGLAAVPAALLVAIRSSFYPLMGFDVVFLASVAAILGGIGSLAGAITGGFVLGIVQALSSWALPSEWGRAVSFGLLTVALVIRPTGLLGTARLRRA